MLGAQIGTAFVRRELDGFTINEGEQEKYSELTNVTPYISKEFAPEVLSGGYYVVTKVKYEGNPIIMVGITTGEKLEEEKIYNGKQPGWVWCSWGEIEDLFDTTDLYTKIRLSYDANGGRGAPNSESYTLVGAETSKKITLSNTKPTKDNYDFLGWSTNSSATTASYDPGVTYTISNDLTLYAVWKISCDHSNQKTFYTCKSSTKHSYVTTCTNSTCMIEIEKGESSHSSGLCSKCTHTLTTTSSPSCTTTGIEKCTVCSKTRTLSSLGHDWSITSSATCLSSGSQKCDRCGETSTISSLGHDWTITSEATCSSTGSQKCDRCGETSTLSKTSHDVYRLSTSGCTLTYKCRYCSYSYTSTNHSYSTVTEATCTTNGTKKCSCGATETIYKLGHNGNPCKRCGYTEEICICGEHPDVKDPTKTCTVSGCSNAAITYWNCPKHGYCYDGPPDQKCSEHSEWY